MSLSEVNTKDTPTIVDFFSNFPSKALRRSYSKVVNLDTFVE